MTNTFPARTILACIPPGKAKILSVAALQGRLNSPFAGLARDGLTNRQIGSWLLVSLCPEVPRNENTHAHPRLPAADRLLPAGSLPAARLHRHRRTGRGGGRVDRHCDQSPVWPPKILNTYSLVLFALIAVLGFTLGKNDDRWLATWGGAGVGIILGLIILALIPVIPFTVQFARESVPEAEWSSPTFKKINRVLSTGWGLAIFAVGLSRVAAAAINGHTTRRLPEILLGLVIPGAIILYMLKFSKSYPDRVTHHEPAQASAGH